VWPYASWTATTSASAASIAAGTLSKSTTVPPYSMLNCMTRTVASSTTSREASVHPVTAIVATVTAQALTMRSVIRTRVPAA
jgi:hypothetical protein